MGWGSQVVDVHILLHNAVIRNTGQRPGAPPGRPLEKPPQLLRASLAPRDRTARAVEQEVEREPERVQPPQQGSRRHSRDSITWVVCGHVSLCIYILYGCIH